MYWPHESGLREATIESQEFAVRQGSRRFPAKKEVAPRAILRAIALKNYAVQVLEPEACQSGYHCGSLRPLAGVSETAKQI
jgi:hypothetical protein